MAVVINEFEVVPAESHPNEPQSPREEPTANARPRDIERDLERLLDRKRARMARLMAV